MPCLGVHEHPAGEVANQREAKREIEKGIARKHEVADLEMQECLGHAVVAAELHDADSSTGKPAVCPRKVSLEQQGENEREDGGGSKSRHTCEEYKISEHCAATMAAITG